MNISYNNYFFLFKIS